MSKKPTLSFYAFLIGIICLLYTSLVFCPRWQMQGVHSTLGWDASTYYWYLPATFIYKDLKHQKFGDSIIAKYQLTPAFEQSYTLESGNRVITYSSGMAVLYLSFFTAAHFLAEPLGYAADGFTTPYLFAIQMGSLLAAIIGIWYYRRLMLFYFSDKVVALLLLLLVIGTNYLNYAAVDLALTHNWLFTIYALLLLNTHYFYQSRKTKNAIAIGLLCGLAILVRPSEIICVMLPLLWGMENLRWITINERLSFLWTEREKLFTAAAGTILIGSIQVAYWFYVSGKPFVYSYNDKTFSWFAPHFENYIFSFRSGWLTYTPMVILFFLGIIPFIKFGKNKVAVLLFFALNLYIVCAWDVWWYGGTGGRAMIQSYPVILFPFASLLQYILDRKVLAWVMAPILLVFTYFNIWFTYNAHAGQGLYDPEGMTNQYYWRVVFRYKVPEEVTKLKDTDELFEGNPKNMKLLFTDDFEDDTAAVQLAQPPISGKVSIVTNTPGTFTPASSFAYSPGHAQWLRAQAFFHTEAVEWEGWKRPSLFVKFSNKGRVVKQREMRVHRFLWNGATKELFIDLRIPDKPFDSVHVMMANPGSRETLLMDELKVWSFNEE